MFAFGHLRLDVLMLMPFSVHWFGKKSLSTFGHSILHNVLLGREYSTAKGNASAMPKNNVLHMPVMMSPTRTKMALAKGKCFLPRKKENKEKEYPCHPNLYNAEMNILPKIGPDTKSFPCLTSSIYSLVTVSNIPKIATNSRDTWIAWLPGLRTDHQTFGL